MKKILILCLIILYGCQNPTFNKITYSNFYCEGECPVFEINIYANGTALYKAIAFNKENKGYYIGYLDSIQILSLRQYFKNENVRNLKNIYKEKDIVDYQCADFVFYLESGEN